MEKTTMYLTPEIQRGLQALAKRTGRSQAELIREALTRYLADQEPPTLPSFTAAFSVGGDAGVDKRRYREEWTRDLEAKRAGLDA